MVDLSLSVLGDGLERKAQMTLEEIGGRDTYPPR
jgi:hypothetical protein